MLTNLKIAFRMLNMEKNVKPHSLTFTKTGFFLFNINGLEVSVFPKRETLWETGQKLPKKKP